MNNYSRSNIKRLGFKVLYNFYLFIKHFLVNNILFFLSYKFLIINIEKPTFHTLCSSTGYAPRGLQGTWEVNSITYFLILDLKAKCWGRNFFQGNRKTLIKENHIGSAVSKILRYTQTDRQHPITFCSDFSVLFKLKLYFA